MVKNQIIEQINIIQVDSSLHSLVPQEHITHLIMSIVCYKLMFIVVLLCSKKNKKHQLVTDYRHY